MELINQFEQSRRGAYGGRVGDLLVFPIGTTGGGNHQGSLKTIPSFGGKNTKIRKIKGCELGL